MLTPEETDWLDGYHARVAQMLSPLVDDETRAGSRPPPARSRNAEPRAIRCSIQRRRNDQQRRRVPRVAAARLADRP
jgi:hypothetical protein